MGAAQIFPLTGIDFSDPIPGTVRELANNRGVASGSGNARQACLYGNKLASIGSGSVDGLGDPLAVPIKITGGINEVINRFGYGSELLLMYRDFTAINTVTDLWANCSLPGSGASTVTFTFATISSTTTSVKVSSMGEDKFVPVVQGDTAIQIATNVAAAINTMLFWQFTAANAGTAVVTLTAKTAGSRYDQYSASARMVFTTPTATTIVKGSVTGSSTDDDMTAAILAAEQTEIYCHVNPKNITVAATNTDLGIGQQAFSISNMNNPANGKSEIMIYACKGTNAQMITTVTAVNSFWCANVWAKNCDLGTPQMAARFAAAKMLYETSDKGANLTDCGRDSRPFNFPVPFAPTDRPTNTELRGALNNGGSPVAFTANGQSYIVGQVTNLSLTNGVNDYRGRSGHMPSCMHDYWDGVGARYASIKQPKSADDPPDGQKPLPGFTYPHDVAGVLRNTIDDKIDGGAATLDPSVRQQMKDSVLVGRLPNGFSSRVQIAVVRHNDKSGFLIEEVSPNI